MKTITSKWCLLILGFILSFNMYAQDTLTILPLTGSNTCDGKAIVNHTIVNTSWTWHDSTGTNVLQTNGDTLKNLCKGNYILKFYSSVANDTKTVRFHIGMQNVNQCGYNAYFNTTTDSSKAGSTCSGSISLNVNGAVGAFQYSIDNGQTFVSNNVFQNVCTGNYNVQVKNAQNCIVNLNAFVPGLNNGGNGGTNNGPANNGKPCQAYWKANPLDTTGLNFHFYDTSRVDAGATITSYVWKMDGQPVGTTATVDQLFTTGKHRMELTITTSAGCTDSYIDSADFPNLGGNNGGNDPCANTSFFVNIGVNNSTAVSPNCNGSLIATISGVANYTYSWSNNLGNTSLTQNNLCPGTYTLTVTANGCTKTETRQINQGTANNCANSNLNANISTIKSNLSGANCSGEAVFTVNGGVAPYNYTLSNTAANGSTLNSNTPHFVNLCDGNYMLTVHDSLGCIKTLTLVIPKDTNANNNPCANSNLSANTNTTPNNSTVGSTCSGSLDVFVNGGHSPYAFSTDNGATFTPNHLQTSICDGTYTIQVKDSVGCIITVTAVVPKGNNNGGGNNGGPANNGKPCQAYFKANPLDTTGLKFHFYDTSRIEAAATITSYVWKMDGQPVGSTSSVDQIFTTGNHNMSLTITTSAGCTDTYIDSASFPMIENNGGNNPCANSQLNVILTETNVTSATKCDGTLTAVVNGSANYTYLWSNNLGNSKLNQTNLCQGNYTITVTDTTNGCKITQTRTVGINPPKNNCQGSTLAATIVTNPALNAATCNGKIVINATGGRLPYKFSADNGVTIVNTSIFNNICAGTYNVGVEDSLGCILHLTATVALDTNNAGTNPCANTTISGLVSSVVPTKTGTCVGKVSIDAHGGRFPYSFVLTSTSSASLTTKTPHFTNLCGGNYNVKIIDSLGCSKSIYVVVPVDTTTAPDPCLNSTLAATTSTTKAFNAATCNGKIIVQATGGQAPYNYSADNGTTVTTQNVISNLCAGNYNVVVKDNLGCLVNVNATVKVDSVIVAPNPCNGTTLNGYVSALTPTATDSTCTGKFYINAKGGRAPYKFNVVNNGGASGNALAITTPFFDSLCAGNYTAVIIDSVGCIKSFPVIVPVDTASQVNPCKGSALAITFVSTNSTSLATANCNGALTATVSGAANYTYSWSNGLGNTNLTQSGLCPGMYKLTVNANGCIKTETGLVQVGAPQDPCTGTTLNGAVIYTVPTTTGSSVGKVGVYATGGALPYTYILKSNTATGASLTSSTPNFNNLTEGTYSVIIKDSLGCTKNFIAKVGAEATTPPSNPCLNSTLYVTMTETNVSAQGQKDGSLVATVAGAANYTYTWSNNLGSSSLTQTNLAPGIYKVKVTSNGCSFEATGKVGINVPTNPCVNSTLSVALTSTDVTSASICNGSIYSTVAGGVAPYKYNWNTSDTTSYIDTLCNDTYKLVVKDAQGCYVISTGVVAKYVPVKIPLTGYVIPVGETTANGCDGSASAIVYGGTAPYTYLYSNNSTESSTPYLCGGLQKLVVKDAANDSLVLQFVISSPANTLNSGNVTNGSTNVVDSLYSKVVSNCKIPDFSLIDSAKVKGYKLLANDSISVDWIVYYNHGVDTINVNNKYALDFTAGNYKFTLQLLCPTKLAGQFLTAYDQLSITQEGSGSAGLDNVEINNVGIYPNPFSDHIIISLDNDESSEVLITDIAGKEVVNRKYNDKLIKIDMNTLSSGSYIVTVRNNNTVTTKQIVK